MSGGVAFERLFFGEGPALRHGLLGERRRSGGAVSASVRAYAAMSSAAFFAVVSSIPPPPPDTGCAAPMCVPGAIAATSAAIVMMNPADAARLPDGADEDRNRRPGRDHLRDDVARRVDEAAGRAQGEDDERGMLGIGTVDRVDHVLRGNGMDDAVDFCGVDDLGLEPCPGEAGCWAANLEPRTRTAAHSTRHQKPGTRNCRPITASVY